MSTLTVTTTDGSRTSLNPADAYRLGARLRGELLLPGDNAYDHARRVWNGMVDHRPALIARCATVEDVVEAVRFGRDHDLLVSVRGGGHNIAGKAVCDGGLVIDQTLRRAVAVDAATRTARVEAGATLGEFDAATQAHALATTVGVVTHTGVAGLTLGGGVGRLARAHGLACDNLVSVQLVTAEGLVLTADDDENTELFWGVRGAGANFGVATSFTFRLHPVGPQVLGGAVIHTLDQAPAVLRSYADFAPSAPDALSADAFLLTSPDGHPVLAVSVCWLGAHDEGERVLEPLRRVGRPLVDQIGLLPYTELQAVGDAFFPTGLNFYWKSHFREALPDEVVAASVEHYARVPSPRSLIGFQQFGGAVSRIDPAATAFRHRSAQWDSFAAAVWTDRDDTARQRAWVHGWWEGDRALRHGGGVREQPRRRGPLGAGGLRRQLRAPRRPQGQVRPHQLLPAQCQRPSRRLEPLPARLSPRRNGLLADFLVEGALSRSRGFGAPHPYFTAGHGTNRL